MSSWEDCLIQTCLTLASQPPVVFDAPEPVVLYRDSTPATQQIATVCGVTEAEIVAKHCAHMFPRLDTLFQRAPPLLVGLQAVLGLPLLIHGMFARNVLTVLHDCLSLLLLPGFCMHVWINDEAASAVSPFAFAEGDSLTVRLLLDYPRPVVAPAAASDLDVRDVDDGDSMSSHEGASGQRPARSSRPGRSHSGPLLAGVPPPPNGRDDTPGGGTSCSAHMPAVEALLTPCLEGEAHPPPSPQRQEPHRRLPTPCRVPTVLPQLCADLE